MNTRNRATAIIVDEGSIALIYRKIILEDGSIREYYTYPGGGVEEGETDEEAAVREAKEETNLDVEIIKQIGEYTYEDATPELRYKHRHIVVLCKKVYGDIAIGEGPEISTDDDISKCDHDILTIPRRLAAGSFHRRL